MAWPWRKTRLSPGVVGYDFHNHLLPGVDDGAADADQSFEAIAVLITLGYRGAVVTPHIYPDAYNNTEGTLRTVFEAFEPETRARFPDFSLALAAEYLLDEALLRRVVDRPAELLTTPAGEANLLLVELPVSYEPAELMPLLEHCHGRDLRVVLAHVERYGYLFDTGGSPAEGFEAVRRSGALIQMNLGSPVGRYGSTIQKRARALWTAGMVDLVGSDLHQARGADVRLGVAWKYLGKHAARFDDRWHRAMRASVGEDDSATRLPPDDDDPKIDHPRTERAQP